MASIADSVVPGQMNPALEPPLGQVSCVVEAGEEVEDLEENMEDLNRRPNDLENVVEEAERDQTQRCTHEANGWLNKVTSLDTMVRAIRAKYYKRYKCFGRCSGDIISTDKIGSKATETLERVKDLYGKLGATVMGRRLTLPLPPPPGSNLSEVLGYLADGVAVVGIVGMGGVGKTTLLESINNYLTRCNATSDTAGGRKLHFEHVIWAAGLRDDAGSPRLGLVILAQLMNQIKEREYSTRLQRGLNKLMAALRKKPSDEATATWFLISLSLLQKKFVLLLDDVWEHVDLGAIGVPTQGRTVVFTTRSENVCRRMGAKKKIKMGCLAPEDAWQLFKEKVGDDVINVDLRIEGLAREVTKECGGLPLALTTIGRAMSSKESTEEWERALSSLKEKNKSELRPSAEPDAEKNWLPLLSYSYDSLGDDATRECFLCCALFRPEDWEFSVDELIGCFLGHGLIEAYIYGYKIILNLESACLLTLDRARDSVKMHDIIRDMALWIACDYGKNENKWIARSGRVLKGANKGWEMAYRISLISWDTSGPETLDPYVACPNLSTLMLRCSLAVVIPTRFCEYCPKLTYLDLSYASISALPEGLTMIVQLQYLNLSYTSIERLSEELSKLANLKYFLLRHCKSLKYVQHGLISSFTTLQLLDICGTLRFCALERRHNDQGRVINFYWAYSINIVELKSLRGSIKALALAMKLHELSTLHEYVDTDTIFKLIITGFPGTKSTDALVVGKNVRGLKLEFFYSLEELTLTSNCEKGHFPWLRALALCNLSKLRMITWEQEVSQATFPLLTYIVIRGCHQLKNLSWIRHVPSLAHLRVHDCDELTEIIPDEDDGSRTPSIFPNLRGIDFGNLPELSSIYSGAMDCPSLELIRILHCRRLRTLPFSFQSHMAKKKLLNLDFWPIGQISWPDDIKSYIEQFIRHPEKRQV